MSIQGYDPSSPKDVSTTIDLLVKGYKVPPPEVIKHHTAGLPYDSWKQFPLGDEVISFARKRGINPDTLEAFGIGQANKETLSKALEETGESTDWVRDSIFMTMPTFHFGKFVMIKMRIIAVQGKKGRFIAVPGSAPGIFGFSNISNNSHPIAIVKGKIPLMVLWERGIKNIGASTAGEGTIEPSWSAWTSWAQKAIVIGDNDPEKITVLLAPAYKRRCDVFRAQLHFPPQEYQGVDDWVLAQPSAIEGIQAWML